MPTNSAQNISFPTVEIKSGLVIEDNDYLLESISKESKPNISEVNSKDMDVLNENTTNLFGW